MPKYRKKPVVIEAQQLTNENFADIVEWVDGIWDIHGAFLLIDTLEGQMRGDIGDFIIKGVQGEFYPCKPDIFYSTYFPVEEQESTPVSNGLFRQCICGMPVSDGTGGVFNYCPHCGLRQVEEVNNAD